MKIGRNEFEIDKNDVIFDNSACYQIITRRQSVRGNINIPIMAKVLFKKLLKDKIIYLLEEEYQYTTTSGKDIWYRYYKFDITRLNKIS